MKSTSENAMGSDMKKSINNAMNNAVSSDMKGALTTIAKSNHAKLSDRSPALALWVLLLTIICFALAGCGGGGSGKKGSGQVDEPEQPGNGGDNGGEETPLAAPSNVVALAGDGQVVLTWSAVANAIGYRVVFATTAGGVANGTVAGTSVAPSFTHTGLVNDTTYYYRVMAINAAGEESALSAEVSAAPIAEQVTFSVQVTGTGTGAVQQLSFGVDCSANCSYVITNGTQLTLSAVPAASSDFVGWSGGCSGNDLNCTVLIAGNTQVGAQFALKAPELIAERYAIEAGNDAIVRDVQSGLEWMRCAFGKTWNSANARCDGTAQLMTAYEAAAMSFSFAGRNDWRLPTREELQSLVYCSSGSPAFFNTTTQQCNGSFASPVVYPQVFPNTDPVNHWTSSTFEFIDTVGFGIDFSNGFNSSSNKATTYPVRFVRSAN